jgi:predicted GNAT family N-acyltransferase
MLNEYIKTQAGQDVRRDLSACFVFVDTSDTIKGYYTLSANSIKRNDFPETLQKKLPSGYGDIPSILLGRLALDNSIKGKGLGAGLLIDALKRCLDVSEKIGAIAVVVDPIDEKAQRFYNKYGFIFLPGSAKMFLPMKTIKELIHI